jgi:hypothetical protein
VSFQCFGCHRQRWGVMAGRGSQSIVVVGTLLTDYISFEVGVVKGLGERHSGAGSVSKQWLKPDEGRGRRQDASK